MTADDHGLSTHVPETAASALPEERQFRTVVWAAALITLMFAYVFVMLTLSKARHSSGDINANWFSAWGSWAQGLGTTAAFLVAAYSIVVTSAHARTDRHDAAAVRQNQDMAQARLLMIYRVNTPTIPRSMVTYQLENRSNDVFFDVTVPHVNRQNDSDAEMGRTTPQEADSSLQYLPHQELLTPFRNATGHEGWFTQVVVYTSDPDSVRFAVEYTDAAGLRWKQHLGGRIEPVSASGAVPIREADRFQPPSPIRLLTPEEAADPRGLLADVPRGFGEEDDEDDDPSSLYSPDELVAFAEDWKPVGRMGTPHATPVARNPEAITVEIPYGPVGPGPWKGYFSAKLHNAGFTSFQGRAQEGSEVEAVVLEVSEDGLEQVIGVVDEAIELANQQFEGNEVACGRDLQARRAAREQQVAERQERLDQRTTAFAKPGTVPWRRHTTDMPGSDDSGSDTEQGDEDGE